MKVDYAYCSKCGHEFLDTDIDFEIGLRSATTQWLYCPGCNEMSISEHYSVLNAPEIILFSKMVASGVGNVSLRIFS